MAQRKRRRQQTLSDQLRVLIAKCGKSQYRICKETGIDPSQLSRFMHDKGQMTNGTMDRIAAFLKITLITESNEK